MPQYESIIAVQVGTDQVTWTQARWRKQVLELDPVGSVTWTSPEDIAEREAHLAESVKVALSEMTGPVVAILSSDLVLLRIVDLPSRDATELTDMVHLQVDKFAPFALEHMVVSYEVLDEIDVSSRVLIAACKRSVVEDVGRVFGTAGFQLARVEVASVAWWRLLEAHVELPEEGRHGIILMDSTGCVLIIIEDNCPILMRVLGSAETNPDDDFYQEIAEEAAYTLTSLESEWGVTDSAVEMTVWCHAEEVPDSLLNALQSACAAPVSVKSFSDVPPLTECVARRSMEGQGRVVDLSLPEWKELAETRAARRRFMTVAGCFLLAWLSVMAVILLLSHIDRGRIERIRAEIAALEGPAEEARLLRRRVESLEQYADRTYSALEVLREITELLPPGVELTSFSYRKGGVVNVRGESSQVPPIYDFFEAMEQSSLFLEVKPEGVTQAPGGRRKPEFRLSASLPGEIFP